MAITLELYHVWFQNPSDLSDYLAIPWTESDEEHEIEVIQQVNVAGFVRNRRTPGVRNVYNYTFRGLNQATVDALASRAGELQYMRDSRGVAAYGMFGTQQVKRWKNPRISDVSITFYETSSQFVNELISV